MRWRRTRPAAAAGPPLCSCGTPLDLIHMDFGFQLPDRVFNMDPDERAARLRGRSKVFVLDEETGYVRTLLPVALDHGSVTFGIWLEVPSEQARHADEVWDAPEYGSLVFTGRVANRLKPWGAELLGAAATARPTDQSALPYVIDGADIVRSLLHEPWPRALVVEALPGLGHAHP